MNILVADDHTFVRTGIKQGVERLFSDATILEAENATEVLALCGQTQLDLILLDLFMPDMDGFELLRKLFSVAPQTPVLVVSATSFPQHVRRVMEIGASGFVHKHDSEDVFEQAIRQTLDGGTYFPSELFVEVDPVHLDIPADHDTSRLAAIKDTLTPRQFEIFKMIGEGKSNKLIARDLGLSDNTIKVHVSTIFKLLELDNRTQVGVLANKLNLI